MAVTPAGIAGANRLKRYWAFGKGQAKWLTWRELRRQLAEEGVPEHMLDGETTNIYRMRFGHMPPHGDRHGGKKGKK